MVRLRRVPVLVSTLALVAGCGSADRVEVSGVVRDSRTGVPLAGARVTGADGVATHTDAEGHFTLAVVRGMRTQLRVSAEGHIDSVQAFGADAFVSPEMLAFELRSPLELRSALDLRSGLAQDEEADPDAVVRWRAAAWVWEASRAGHAEAAHDAAVGDARALDVSAHRACRARASVVGDTSDEDEPDVDVIVDGTSTEWLGAGAACVECHRASSGIGPQAEVLLGRVGPEFAGSPHAFLADSCLACHDHEGADGARQSCARCHGLADDAALAEGDPLATLRAVGDLGGVENETGNEHRSWDVELPIGLTLDRDYEAAVADARAAMRRRLVPSRVSTWLELLERDGSRGAHNPRLVAALRAHASP